MNLSQTDLSRSRHAGTPVLSERPRMVVVMGGGAAGLTAACELCKAGIPCIVLEKDAQVGGLARTIDYKGYRFDIGGHRFFTKVKAVDDLWREILPPSDFRRRKRQLVGRNGTHRYNNQDHSMLTAMLAVRTLLGERHDLWKVNADASYHEAMDPAESPDAEIASLEHTQPRVPRRVSEA